MSVLIKLRDFQTLPAAENEIRKFILKNPKEVLDMTIYEVAKLTYTSPATVVRLCKRMDVKGFNKMKIELSSEVKSFDNLHLELLDSTSIQKEDSTTTIIDKITNIAFESIEETRLLLNIKDLQTAVAWIKDAKIIDLYGVGASNIVALDALYKFMRVGKTAACYSLYDRQYVQSVNSNADHVGLIFSYSGETKEMIEIANMLRKNGTNVISVTSSSSNSLIKLSDINLNVSMRETIFRSGAMASRTSSLYIVDLLYALYCRIDYDHAAEMIELTRITNDKTNNPKKA